MRDDTGFISFFLLFDHGMLTHVVFHLPLPLLDLTDPSFGTILGPSMAPIEDRE